MGRTFIKHPGECSRIWACRKCNTPIVRHEDVLDPSFTSQSGPAMLAENTVNLVEGEITRRAMITGMHHVCAIHCLSCKHYLGWKYEFTHADSQRYKEGRFVLENAYMRLKDGRLEKFENPHHHKGPPHRRGHRNN